MKAAALLTKPEEEAVKPVASSGSSSLATPPPAKETEVKKIPAANQPISTSSAPVSEPKAPIVPALQPTTKGAPLYDTGPQPNTASREAAPTPAAPVNSTAPVVQPSTSPSSAEAAETEESTTADQPAATPSASVSAPVASQSPSTTPEDSTASVVQPSTSPSSAGAAGTEESTTADQPATAPSASVSAPVASQSPSTTATATATPAADAGTQPPSTTPGDSSGSVVQPSTSPSSAEAVEAKEPTAGDQSVAVPSAAAPEISTTSDGHSAPGPVTSKKPEPAPEGITTVDLEEGNWFLKRQALEKTMNVIEALNTLFTKILDLRMTFLVKRNKVDRDFDLFAKQTGFEIGDLSQMVANFIGQMDQERKKEGQLSEQERQFLRQMEQKLEELKKLQTDIASITDMDAAIDDVLMQVEKEIDQSHQHQMQGWRNFQSIKKVLNDEKAEELYLKTEGLLNNMKDIYSYIHGQLLAYFNTMIQNLQETMSSATSKLDALKSAGNDLKQTLDKFLKADDQAEKEREDEIEQQRIEQAKRTAIELEKKQQIPFRTQLITYIKMPFIWLWNTIMALLGR